MVTPSSDFAGLKEQVKTFPTAPGVYRMLDREANVLYVGKARNIKNRVSSYFRNNGLSLRIQSMMLQVESVEITVTHTENEALILENNLIKSLHPRYNILLRDDKSYPYILLTEHEYPRLTLHRGAKKQKGKYFGPYPSAGAVRETLHLLQKVFGVRQCEEAFFNNRSRPCLQYQIKRCGAPCVGLISPQQYAKDVQHTVMFLQGRSRAVIDEVGKKMEDASMQLDYESAARYRDQVAALSRVQEQQFIDNIEGDADAVALAQTGGSVCITINCIRSGRNLGSRNFIQKVDSGVDEADLLSAFLSQYYINRPVPMELLVNTLPTEFELLQEAFRQAGGKRVAIHQPQRGQKRQWLKITELNATEALRRHLLSKTHTREQCEALQTALELDALPERMECFDISHTMGEETVASCVVFDSEGPVKSDYRRFNIKDVTPGDDYAAMKQAVKRRYKRIQDGEGRVPDILFIDGGKGQLSVVQEVLDSLQVNDLLVVAVAKGEERKPGLERLFLRGREQPSILPPDSPALHLIQQIRDEAHRFAITGHRQRRARKNSQSPLETLPGIGQKRRQALLRSFGGLQEVARAGVEDLKRVPGISPVLAQRIYDAFHE